MAFALETKRNRGDDGKTRLIPGYPRPMRKDELITTRSRVKAWFLIRLRGYSVDSKASIPRPGFIREMAYDTEWTLYKKKGPAKLDGRK